MLAFVPISRCAAEPDHDQADRLPNILFIVSDDHGWGDLPSNWDKTEVRLPTLDALAAKGVRSNYDTVPLCGPSRACMFTGQYSTENGMWRGPGSQPLGSPGYRGIKRDVTMLSEHLAETGYKTGAFGKWHLGSLDGEVPNDRGFDEFRGVLGGAHSYWITEGRSKILHNREPDRTAKGHATELFTGWAETFIRESAAKEEPFFCYLAYNAVHGPRRIDESKPASAPEAWVNKALDRGVSFLRSDYVAILEHMDHNIGQLVDLLDELTIAENTLNLFVSYNRGCTMGDDPPGNYRGNNRPFRGGTRTTYQRQLNVPTDHRRHNMKLRPRGRSCGNERMKMDRLLLAFHRMLTPVADHNPGKLLPKILGDENLPPRRLRHCPGRSVHHVTHHVEAAARGRADEDVHQSSRVQPSAQQQPAARGTHQIDCPSGRSVGTALLGEGNTERTDPLGSRG